MSEASVQKSCAPFIMTHMREPMHLSTNSSGNSVDGLVVVEGAAAIASSNISDATVRANNQHELIPPNGVYYT